VAASTTYAHHQTVAVYCHWWYMALSQSKAQTISRTNATVLASLFMVSGRF
jgi:hypothetical protein